MSNSKRLLLASIHDVSPRFAGEVDRLVDVLALQLGGPRFAMLVVPDYWEEAPIAADRAFHRRLRAWHASGVEIFLHGLFHRDLSVHAGWFDTLRAQHLTAGEGEFLGLSRTEAYRRIVKGRSLIEDIIGDRIAGFVAPAWLYGEGARLALRDADIAIAEDHLRVWSPQSGAILARGPVVTWASRSRARIVSSLIVAALARRALQPSAVVRIAVHPGDVTVPAILASIDTTIAALSQRRDVGRYRDLHPLSD